MARKPVKKSKGKASSKQVIKETGGEASGSKYPMGRFGGGKLMDRGIQK